MVNSFLDLDFLFRKPAIKKHIQIYRNSPKYKEKILIQVFVETVYIEKNLFSSGFMGRRGDKIGG